MIMESQRPVEIYDRNTTEHDVETNPSGVKIDYSGWFHCWSHEGRKIGEISEQSTYAVIEKENGQIVFVKPKLVRFTDREKK